RPEFALVRLLWCKVLHNNDETANKDLEIRWTIDGTVYFIAFTLAADEGRWVYRNYDESTGGTRGLTVSADPVNAAFTTDKRGHTFKVEVRTTSVPGTNQILICNCVRETLEET
ncbi:unnamed protein product, partial [marine sediment metagenome]